MPKVSTFFLLLLLKTNCFSQSIPPIGQWREHLPWNNAISIANNDNTLIAATLYAVFIYDKTDGSFTRLSKASGLSDVGTRAMAFDSASKTTVIAYNNSNIDVLKNNKTINMPDIRLSTVAGDKNIYHIFLYNNKAYLSTGIGIIVLNLLKYEVEDTWRIGKTGNNIRVNAVTISGNSIFAATEEGLKSCLISQQASNYNNWTLIQNGIIPGNCKSVIGSNNNVIALKNDSIFQQTVSGFKLMFANNKPINAINFSGNKLMVMQSVQNKGSVVQLSVDGTIVKSYSSTLLSNPLQALEIGQDCWVADKNNGLIKLNGTNAERVFPNSPINVAFGEMKCFNNSIWVAAGQVNSAWNYLYNPNGLYKFADEQWTGINLYAQPKLDSVLDFITITEQPSTGSIFAGSYGGGLVEITKTQQINIYKQGTGLGAAAGDPRSYRVSGLATDVDNNIWISNFGAAQNLVLRKANGQWKSFSIPFLHTENAVSTIVIDDYDQKWIVSPKGNGVFVYQSGKNIDDIGDDVWRYLRKGKGYGNLPSNVVNCIAKDKNGYMWIGTDNGIGIVTCADQVMFNNCEAIIPIVKQDNFAGYLFQDEDIRSIEVDGANRKWVATKNGVWLISAEGDKIIYHYTKDNSPLLSDDVSSIAIQSQTGEVFISTASGICSFRGTATEGDETVGKVLVYPNPVPKGYGGTIAIRGLPNNSWVKITELDGRLVYQTKSLGGQAVWNGKSYNGNTIASGVYLILVSDESNQNKTVAKVFFIR